MAQKNGSARTAGRLPVGWTSRITSVSPRAVTPETCAALPSLYAFAPTRSASRPAGPAPLQARGHVASTGLDARGEQPVPDGRADHVVAEPVRPGRARGRIDPDHGARLSNRDPDGPVGVRQVLDLRAELRAAHDLPVRG